MESRSLLAPLTLLRRAAAFRLLFFATFGSSLGSLLAVVALAIDVKDRTDSGKWVAALLFANLVPGIAVGLTLGPLLDRLLVGVAGPDVAYWINAATFLFSALLIAKIPARLLQSETPITKGHWRDVAEGIHVVRTSLALTTVVIAWSLAMLGQAGYNVAEIFLAKNTFSAGDFGYGLLFGAGGAR